MPKCGLHSLKSPHHSRQEFDPSPKRQTIQSVSKSPRWIRCKLETRFEKRWRMGLLDKNSSDRLIGNARFVAKIWKSTRPMAPLKPAMTLLLLPAHAPYRYQALPMQMTVSSIQRKHSISTKSPNGWQSLVADTSGLKWG